LNSFKNGKRRRRYLSRLHRSLYLPLQRPQRRRMMLKKMMPKRMIASLVKEARKSLKEKSQQRRINQLKR